MGPSDFQGVPLAQGSIFGLRKFAVDKYGRLRGVVYNQVWTPDMNVAVCRRGSAPPSWGTEESPCGDVTSLDCMCGFYGYHTGIVHDDGTVDAVIEGSGKVTIGSKGFRAEKARIVALTLFAATNIPTALVRRNYPDVDVYDDVDDMLEAHPLSVEYAPSPDTHPNFWSMDVNPATPVVFSTGGVINLGASISPQVLSLLTGNAFGPGAVVCSPTNPCEDCAKRAVVPTSRPAINAPCPVCESDGPHLVVRDVGDTVTVRCADSECGNKFDVDC